MELSYFVGTAESISMQTFELEATKYVFSVEMHANWELSARLDHVM
jgi:hypothetical protein